MSEAAEVVKTKAEVLAVTMSDGRVVNFVGKRKVNKETLIDESKIELDEAAGILQIQAGAVSVRMDFRNGETRTLPLGLGLFAKFAGHGGEQKYGDELASTADKPLSEEDMVLAIDDLHSVLSAGKWGRGRAEGGGGVSGAGVVVRAIMEASGKSMQEVKDFLQKKLESNKELTRQALYAAFRAEGTPTAPIIERMEKDKAKKAPAIDAAGALGELASA